MMIKQSLTPRITFYFGTAGNSLTLYECNNVASHCTSICNSMRKLVKHTCKKKKKTLAKQAVFYTEHI